MRDGAQPRGSTGTISCRQPRNVPAGMTDVTPLPAPSPTLCPRARERCHLHTPLLSVAVGADSNLPAVTSFTGRGYCRDQHDVRVVMTSMMYV